MKKNVEKWKDLGFGMFIHFGLYSLLGGVWNGKKIEYGYSEQILSGADIPQLDYFNLINEFKIPNFNAKEIVSLAKNAGMNYITLTTKHHDGFCLFDTKTTDFCSTNSPCKKDIVKEISQECKKQGLKFGIYYSWIDWHYPHSSPMSNTNSDIITKEHQLYNIAQLTELLSNYGEITELWMDMGAPSENQSREIYELAHKLQPNIMINSRIWNDWGDFLTMGDNDYPEVTLDVPWQVPATIFKETWGYRSWQKRENIDEKIKDLSTSIKSVLDCGGNFLLNIGPDDKGAVVKYENDVLLGIGKDLRKRNSLRMIEEKGIIPIEINNLSTSKGRKHFNYSGSEYYSNHPIITGLSWRVSVEKNKNYKLGWINKSPLKENLKLKLTIDNNHYYIYLREGRDSNILSEKIKTNKDYIDISISSIGNNLKIEELKVKDIKITLN